MEERIRKLFVELQLLVCAREGASGIEYAIVAAMCAAVIGIFMTPISERVTALFQLVETSLLAT
ncbi:pilus assembly protein [Pseudomonas sp. S35]|uniref:Flp family type IVb pilin n=1 Tax=Pseudomonas sp. S35 TaxID=1573719 RepID=UPI00132F00BD|nr:Flp family type IVb pilin [Pseudomonas sp. S35]QHF42867.1 pilus assembly protein [Pseudomonas sp. S35]